MFLYWGSVFHIYPLSGYYLRSFRGLKLGNCKDVFRGPLTLPRCNFYKKLFVDSENYLSNTYPFSG